MYGSFSEIRRAAREISGARVAVPMGHDPSSVSALVTAAEQGLASAVIVGPRAGLDSTLEELGVGLPDTVEVFDTEDSQKAAIEAVRLVSSGEAGILMKGLLKTSVFLGAVLDEEVGLRTGRVLSHVAVVHVPLQDRLVAVTDGGMNIRPDEETLPQLIENAAGVVRALGSEEPRVALLAAIEVENEKMPETLLFAAMARRGVPGALVDGPMAVDGAMDPEAASIKGMEGPVAGRAEVLVTPDIASGNIFAKAFMYMTDAEVGGMIAGASAPVVMLSRSDKPSGKLNSLALGVVVAEADNGS